MLKLTYMLVMLLVAACACAVDDPCLSQCALAGRCEEKAAADFLPFDAEREAVRASNPQEGMTCEEVYPRVEVGACADGKAYIATYDGMTSRTLYYAQSSSEFLGLSTTTDLIDDQCRGRGYWPAEMRCEPSEVSELRCP